MKIAKLYIFLLMIGMSSCYDDLGNYDYVELNKVSIEGINSNEWYEKLANIDTLFFQPESPRRFAALPPLTRGADDAAL